MRSLIHLGILAGHPVSNVCTVASSSLVLNAVTVMEAA